MSEKVKVILSVAALVAFIAMLIGVGRASRNARRNIAEGEAPNFSWAWFFFSVYLFAQGVYAFVQECLLERHIVKGVWTNYAFQSLAILLLAVGITALSNQVKWLLHIVKR